MTPSTIRKMCKCPLQLTLSWRKFDVSVFAERTGASWWTILSTLKGSYPYRRWRTQGLGPIGPGAWPGLYWSVLTLEYSLFVFNTGCLYSISSWKIGQYWSVLISIGQYWSVLSMSVLVCIEAINTNQYRQFVLNPNSSYSIPSWKIGQYWSVLVSIGQYWSVLSFIIVCIGLYWDPQYKHIQIVCIESKFFGFNPFMKNWLVLVSIGWYWLVLVLIESCIGLYWTCIDMSIQTQYWSNTEFRIWIQTQYRLSIQTQYRPIRHGEIGLYWVSNTDQYKLAHPVMAQGLSSWSGSV